MNTIDALKTINPPLGGFTLTDLLGDFCSLLVPAVFGGPSDPEQPPTVSGQLEMNGEVLESWADATVTYERDAIPNGRGVDGDGVEFSRWLPGDWYVVVSFGKAVCKLKCQTIASEADRKRLG